MLKSLMKKVDIHEEMGNFSKEMKTIKKETDQCQYQDPYYFC